MAEQVVEQGVEDDGDNTHGQRNNLIKFKMFDCLLQEMEILDAWRYV